MGRPPVSALHQHPAMWLPKARNLIVGIVVGALVVSAGLLIAQDQETLQVRTDLAASDPRFPTYLSRLLGHTLTADDAYTVHTNEAAYPAMLAAIEQARHRIVFESYIYQKSDIGDRFTAAFAAAARRGVSVKLVLDSVGAQKFDRGYTEQLEAAGVRIGWFNPVAGISIEEVNYRTHRKALVIDGDVAFVGGISIDDQWAKDTEKEKRWRDTMIQVRGPGAIHIEAAFNENWIETGGVVDPDLLPHEDDEPDGSGQSIVVWSSPAAGTNELKLLFLLAIASARETLDIQSPYLITDESTRWSLADARKRGVRVRMLVEGDITDAKPVKFAGREEYGLFLSQGMEVYEYQPSMMHVKAMVVDGLLSVVGSANFDNRSFELNDELSVAAFDRPLAARLLQDFERDIAQSKKLSVEEWKSRPLHIRGREKFWSFFGELF
jgi:cardiolipin synthase